MKYALLVYARPGSHEALPEDEFNAMLGQYAALRDEPGYVASAQLHPPEMATTLRIEGGQTLTTDGPFADTKEVFGGYYLFDVENVDAALRIAERVPAARLGGSVEVRPIMEPQP
ncbi:MAG: YciI family protein [Solirubrobacteraceae bacterium]